MKKAFMWIAPAVSIMFILFCLMTYSSLRTNANAGIGTLSVIHLVGSLLPVFAFFLTDVKNKITARLLYLILVVGISYLLYWPWLFKYAYVSN
jgi:hypothetical protein